MHSNLQRAVADVLAANQEVKFSNVLTAYIRIAGFQKSSLDVLTTFERAMDKHPDCKDQVNSESAKLVAKLRHDYWKTMFDWGGKQHCCPCCVNLVEQYIDDPDKFEEAFSNLHEVKVHTVPKKLRRRRKKTTERSHKTIAFDPFGPSTSASSM
ncbi:hypothetical protein J132_06383 [Termitomyces sp. J132]|nr:hypothetical protein H2248_007835 [Termitomyces sp. 'cryptogamus']KNZ80313.1 hypothetical protein J132_06383 [Termitomyces sp. J132]